MIKTDSDRQLHSRINVALQLLKNSKNSDERIALANYIGNTYSALQGMKNRTDEYFKKTFKRKKEYFKFLKKIDIYEDQMREHFISNKDFHTSFFEEIMFPVENNLALINYEEVENTILTEDDFYTIFHDFMKSLHLENLMEKLVKEKRIHSFDKDEEQTMLGFTLFNHLNSDIDIFVGNFSFNIQSMFTLAHEFGHVYDLLNFSEDTTKYNKFFYQSFNAEVISKLYERLFITYMINNNILLDESKDKLFDLELINHGYLLGAYILSLLDEEYISNASYALLDKEEIARMVKSHFTSAAAVEDYISSTTYFDLGEDFTYSYGDIISMFLHESIKDSGFDNEFFNAFLIYRCNMFDRDFFNKWEMSPDRYVELHEKELQLLKK